MLRRLATHLISTLKRGPTPAARSKALVAEALEAQRQGEVAAAETALRTAAALDPANVDSRHLLGSLLCRSGRAAEACELLKEVVAHAPHLVEARFNLASALQEAGDTAGAQARYREVVALAPGYSPARSNLAGLLATAGDFDAAIAEYRAAIEANPEQEGLWYNLGNAYMDVRRTPDAVAAYDHAIAQTPAFPEAHFNRALALLRAGQWSAGWPGYEWRFRKKDHPAVWREFGCRLWEDQALAGKTLLVWGEQGLGDEIMFGSCLPRLLPAAARVVVECNPRLREIFQRSFPAAEVWSSGERSESMAAHVSTGDAFHVPIGSLPARLEEGSGPPFQAEGYLIADATRVARWRERLGQFGDGLKVGISWRGGAAYSRTSRRSIELDRWLPILRVPGVKFVSLQYTREYEALAAFERTHGVAVPAWPEAIEDFNETAALIGALDLVISVCNTTVHLGGALGRPVWVLAPYSAEWRYGLTGESMHWYFSVTVLRQPGRGEWGPVIEAAASRLREFAANAGRHGSSHDGTP